MTKKNIDYWKERLNTSSTEDIVAELEEEIVKEKHTEIAYAFLAVVESMSRADERAIDSNIEEIMGHLYLLMLVPKDSQTYQRDHNHWLEEIVAFRKAIRKLLKYEPKLAFTLTKMVEDNTETAKRDAMQRVQDYGLLANMQEEDLPNIPLETIFPQDMLPKQPMVHKELKKDK